MTSRNRIRPSQGVASSSRELLERVLQSGVVTADEILPVFDYRNAQNLALPPQRLSNHLIRRRVLTEFQASTLLDGRPDPLVMGRYVLLEEIGRGGGGRVYKAKHRGLKRIVALKVLSDEHLTQPVLMMRFRREMILAGSLDHPNVVAAYDAGEAAGRLYLVTEFVDGRDLSRIVRERGPLPIEDAVNFVVQASRGLAFAHARGIVHRDVKPGNLLLTRGTEVKVLDLGLARIQESTDQSCHGHLSYTGMVMGTADYMSPEQAVDTSRVDARADIYSLGASLYFLLAGRPPFSARTLVAQLLAHREQPVPSLLDLRPELPPALDEILQTLMAKRPEHRYASMSEVATALQRFLPGSRVTQPPADDDAALNEFLRRLDAPAADSLPTALQASAETVREIARARDGDRRRRGASQNIRRCLQAIARSITGKR